MLSATKANALTIGSSNPMYEYKNSRTLVRMNISVLGVTFVFAMVP